MALNITVKGKSLECDVADELTIYTANEYRDIFIEHLPNVNKIIVDLGAVTEIDSAGLQLLIALKNLAPAHNVEFVHHNATALEAIELAGLAGQFDDAVVIASGARS